MLILLISFFLKWKFLPHEKNNISCLCKALYFPLIYVILCFAFLLNILIIFPQVFKPRFTIATAVKNINNLVPQHATISYNGLIDIKRKDNKNPDYIIITNSEEFNLVNDKSNFKVVLSLK